MPLQVAERLRASTGTKESQRPTLRGGHILEVVPVTAVEQTLRDGWSLRGEKEVQSHVMLILVGGLSTATGLASLSLDLNGGLTLVNNNYNKLQIQPSFST